MNKFTVAAGVKASAERGKPTTVNSKVRSCTRRANFKSSVDARTHRLVSEITRPEPEPKQTVGIYGPKGGIRVWRNG